MEVMEMASNKLKGKIVEAGYSQRSLASELGMSKNTLNSKVNGKIPFNTNEIERICEKLGIHDGAEKAAIFLD
jgi:transcriptional regulator with XRE-family HTH domain